MSSSHDDEGPYSSVAAYLLWGACLFGACGVHRLYMGKIGTGVLYLLTFGLLGIGQLVDLIKMNDLVLLQNTKAKQLRAAARLGLPPARDSVEQLRIKLVRTAASHGGKLTVSQGVLATGKPFKEVEKLLDAMAKSGHVNVEIDEEHGVVVYRFGGLA